MKDRSELFNSVSARRAKPLRVSLRIPAEMQGRIEKIVFDTGDNYSSVVRALLAEALK